jgi:hypothetical protein
MPLHNMSYLEEYNPDAVHVYPCTIEKNIPKTVYLSSLQSNTSIPLLSLAFYFLMIHYGPMMMENRKALKLKSFLFLWNSSLAIFSIVATMRMGSFLMFELKHLTLQQKVCNGKTDNVSALWGYLYILSKVFEMGDTALLILRKKPVIFLHWYHHTTVLLFCWFSGAVDTPICNYFASINCFIHSLMYSYYAAQTIGIRFPKVVSMTLTTLQIAQMVLGLHGMYLLTDAMVRGIPCQVSRTIWLSGILMYGSYFALFLNFFVRNYLMRKMSIIPAAAKVDDANNNNSITCNDKKVE